MRRGRIALVSSDTVPWIETIQLNHLPVTVHLGNNRGRTDGGYFTITFDHGFGTAMKFWTAIAVDECMSRSRIEAGHSTLHREHGGMKNIEFIDLLYFSPADRPRERTLANNIEKLLAPCFAQFFGIGQSFNGTSRIENHGGRNDSTAQGATSYFIDASYPLLTIERERELLVHEAATPFTSKPICSNTASAARSLALRRNCW